MVKKVLMVMALFAVLLVPVFAVQVTVDWKWQINDPAVKYFRYQVDGDAPEGWTVVKSDVTAYSLEDVDGSLSYTLFLQQSYDGIYWSESAISVSEPVVPAPATFEDSFITEEESASYYVDSPVEVVPPVEEVPVVEEISEAVEEEAPVEAVEEVVEPVVVATPSENEGMKIRLSLGFGAGQNRLSGLDNFGTGSLDFNALVRLGFEDIFSSKYVGFEVNVNLGGKSGIPFITGGWGDRSLFADILLGASFKISSFDIYLNIGGRAHFLSNDSMDIFDGTLLEPLQLNLLPSALLGLRYNIGSFSIALEGQYLVRFSRNISNSTHSIEARLLLGYSF